MKETTLGYLEKDGCYLMLHRIHMKKKKQDGNDGKYIGVGGHMEEGETPEACFRREVREETGLDLTECRPRGIVTFLSDLWEDERMYLFTGRGEGDESAFALCDEGRLRYIPKEEILSLRLWEGDKIFLKLLLEDAPFFHLTLVYTGEQLTRAELNGETIAGLSMRLP